MSDIEHGWIATGPDVPPSCELAEDDAELRECAYCGAQFRQQDYPLYTDFDGDRACLNCLENAAKCDRDTLARALQNVLDGVHGAKDAAKTLLAKWRTM